MSTTRETVEKCVKEGYLLKKSMHLKISRKRWVVIMNGKLLSFAKKTNCKDYSENKATEIFDLCIYDKVQRSKKNKNYQFELISTKNGNKRSFEAYSIDDMIAWMIQIEKCQNRLKEAMVGRQMEIEIQYAMANV